MAEEDESFSVFVSNVEYERFLTLSRDLDEAKKRSNDAELKLKRSIDVLERGRVKLEKDIKQRNDDIQSITVDCLKLRKERMELQDRIEDLEEQQEKLMKDNKESKEKESKEKEGLETKLKELTEQLAAKEGLESRITELTEQLNLKEGLETRTKELAEQLKVQEQQSKMFSSRCIELCKKIKTLEQEADRQAKKMSKIVDSSTSTDDLSGRNHHSFSHSYVKEETGPLGKKPAHLQHHWNSPPKVLSKQKTSIESDSTVHQLAEKNAHLELELKNMGNAISQKCLEIEALTDKLDACLKELNSEKLLNENIGKELQTADREYNETVDKLQKDLEERDNRLVEKDRQFDELKQRANLKAENLNTRIKQAEKLLQEQQRERKEVQQQLRSKVNELSLKLSEHDKADHAPKWHRAILEKVHSIVNSCTKKEIEEVKEQLQQRLNLQEEYEKIITENEARYRECKAQNDTLKRQAMGTQRLLNEIMDKNGKMEAQNAALRADIEKLEETARNAKKSNVDAESRYQIALNDLREELRKSQRAQDQLKSIAKMMESKQDYIEYYVSAMRTRLKDYTPRVSTQLLHDDLNEFIKQLTKHLPGK